MHRMKYTSMKRNKGSSWRHANEKKTSSTEILENSGYALLCFLTARYLKNYFTLYFEFAFYLMR